MAAINAAGYDAGIKLPDNSPVRKQLRDFLAGQNIKVLPELKVFFRKHLQKTEAQDLNQYISFAFAVTGAPDFAWKGRDVDVPPDAMALREFQPLMIDFYRQADLETLWKKVKPAYEQEVARYHEPLLNLRQSVEYYLRVTANEYKLRKFHVFVELLAAPQVVQTRSYGDDVYVVVSPADPIKAYDIRHSYLHFAIDPIMLQNRAPLAQKRSLIDLAGTSPLDDSFKTDFVLLANECLIKAVEAKLDKDTAAVERATRQGYILTPYFFEQLPVFEKQQLGMRYYAEEMINGIDPAKETARFATIKFDAAQLQRAAKQVTIAGPEPSGAAKVLEKAENLYSARSYEEARALFTQALEQKGEAAEHAQAWYGLARISIAQNKPETAEELLQKTLESGPDDFTRGWSDYYLGRLARARSDLAEAEKYYRDALAVKEVSEKVKQLAGGELEQVRQAILKSQEKTTQ